MVSYQVQWCEEKTSAKGTQYKRCSLQDDNGQMFEDVAVFKSYEKYVDVKPGAQIEGVLKSKTYNGKVSYNLDNLISSQAPSARTAVVARAQERKEKTISQSMDRKEEGIKLSSTFRDATLITTALASRMSAEPTRDWFESEWKRWRAWLWNVYDSVDVTDVPPFE